MIHHTNFSSSPTPSWLDAEAVCAALSDAESIAHDKVHVRDILVKAADKKGLTLNKTAVLMTVRDPEVIAEMFMLARQVKESVYGRRISLFAPLYISNHCKNECIYCAFRVSNLTLKRRALTMDEIAAETRILVTQGHRRVMMVSGESYPTVQGFDYVLDAVATI